MSIFVSRSFDLTEGYWEYEKHAWLLGRRVSDNIDMLANVGAMWTRWPKVGNLNPSNLTLLVGSTWDQHDDSTSANVCGLKSVSLSRNTHVCVIIFV